MKKWFPFVLSVLCLLSVRFSLAQEPFFNRVVEICINGSGACVLPDGSFVLCGNDGTVSDDRPAKAVCVSPYGDIVWEVTDKYAESAANDFLSLAALPSGDIMLSTTAHCIKDDMEFIMLHRQEKHLSMPKERGNEGTSPALERWRQIILDHIVDERKLLIQQHLLMFGQFDLPVSQSARFGDHAFEPSQGSKGRKLRCSVVHAHVRTVLCLVMWQMDNVGIRGRICRQRHQRYTVRHPRSVSENARRVRSRTY